MDWDAIWKIALAIIASVGGIGGVIVAVVKFCGDRIAERLQMKYQHSMDQELEKYKWLLDQSAYVKKARFDVAFQISQELFASFNSLVNDVFWLFPNGLDRITCPLATIDHKRVLSCYLIRNQCYDAMLNVSKKQTKWAILHDLHIV